MKKILSLLLVCLLLCGCTIEYVPGPTQGSAEPLTVHFIDVGQADCALVEWAGFYILIDGGNRDDSDLVVSYLENQNVQNLNAVICSHAHEDHVGGLPAVLAVYPTMQVYAPTKTYSSKVFDDFVYYADQQGLEITIPSPGDQLTFSNGTDEIRLTVLGPVQSYAETNDTSIVVKLEYGDTAFLFTGDMEVAAENDMLDHWEGRMDWNVDVLKVGHHGSSTSSGYRIVYETDPEYAIISCGRDNSYGHPHREIVERYNDAGVPLFRTDELGTILAVSDGSEVTITWENRNAAPEDVPPGDPAQTFIGNKNSKVFHAPSCDSLPAEKNRVEFDGYDAAVEAGYKPCGGCLG